MSVVTLLNAVSANTTGPVAGLETPYGNLTLAVSATGTVSAFSVQLLGSEDSVNWASIGSAVTSTTAGESVGTGTLFQYFQATLSGYSGTGTVTAILAYSLEPSASGGGGPPTGTAGGDLSGTYPDPSVALIGGVATSGKYARGNGTAVVLSTIQAADLPAATTSAKGAVQFDGTASDIQAAGTQAAGASGLGADARHVHPASFWVPADSGLLAATMDPASTAANQILAAGTVYLAKITVRAGFTISNIVVPLTVAGNNTGGSAGTYAGLYSSSGTLLSGSSDVASSLTGTGTVPLALTTPQAVTAGSFVWAAILVNLGTTQPTLAKAAGNNVAFNFGLTAATFRFATAGTTQTSLPGPITPSSNAAGAAYAFLVGVS